MPSKRRLYNLLTLGIYNKLKRLEESEAEQSAAAYEVSEFYRKMLEGLKNEELREREVKKGWMGHPGPP